MRLDDHPKLTVGDLEQARALGHQIEDSLFGGTDAICGRCGKGLYVLRSGVVGGNALAPPPCRGGRG